MWAGDTLEAAELLARGLCAFGIVVDVADCPLTEPIPICRPPIMSENVFFPTLSPPPHRGKHFDLWPSDGSVFAK